jgi:phosphoserine phosphatase RsbU/P
MRNRPLKVLYIGSDEKDFFLIRDHLRKMKEVNTGIQWMSDFNCGMEMLRKKVHDVCLADFHLGQRNGLDFIRKAIRSGCVAPIIMLSDRRDHALDIKAMKAGAADYLIKPEIQPSVLEHSMRYSMAHKHEEQALRNAKHLQQEAKEKLEKAMQSINEELEMAGKLQKSMLPRDIAEINGLSLATAYLPCGRVGGDLYDIIKIDETRTCFLMFDVVGHGVPAALISAMVKVSFNKNITRSASPADIMERVNKEIVSFFYEKRHITAFIAIYDNATREIIFAGGGHPSPIVLHPKERRLEYLISRGLPLGMFGEVQYEVSRSRLNQEDVLVLYTDGLVECHDSNDALFGKKRLEGILTSLSEASSADDVLGAIIKSQFSMGVSAKRSDDVSIVIIKIP